MFAKRNRSVWTEGGATFMRFGMVIKQVIRCESCDKLRLATILRCECVVVPILKAKGEA